MRLSLGAGTEPKVRVAITAAAHNIVEALLNSRMPIATMASCGPKSKSEFALSSAFPGRNLLGWSEPRADARG